jgi:hypothetical protein
MHRNMSATVRQRVQRGLAVVLVALAVSDAGATTASFLGALQVTFKGRADDGTQILLEAVVQAVADGTGGDAFVLSRRPVPPLADIPLLNALFKKRTDRKAQFGSATDLFLLLTPNIITDDPVELMTSSPASARTPPIAPPALAPGDTTLGGVFKVDRTFQRATLKAKLKYEGIAQDGALAGQTVKGKVKLRFSGDRL